MNQPSGVPIPYLLSLLPRDSRGWPITYTSLKLPDGRYDFTTSDPLKWAIVAACRCCALCGIVLKREIWFIGGPKSMRNRFFFDLAMHEECARYALQVCPYLAMPKYLGAKKRLTPADMRVELVSSDKTKPVKFGLAKTNGYKLVKFQGDKLVLAKEWLAPIEWWKDGSILKENEPCP